MSKRADRRHLVEVAYADDRGLRARSSLYEHARPRLDLIAETLDLVGELREKRVLDVGCGNGRYMAAITAAGGQVVGVDLSAGMLTTIPARRPPVLVADAQQLPIADAAVDVVLLMHMLYHVPNPEHAVEDARRVLGPSGRVVVGVGGPNHLVELNARWTPLVGELGVRGDLEDIGLVNPRLRSDQAHELLKHSFPNVLARLLRTKVVLTDPEPAVRHAASTTAAHTLGAQHPELLDRLRADISECIARDGDFRITSEVALLLAHQ